MHLYIVRHGIAVAVGDNGVSTDAERMLTAVGRRKTKRAAEGLRCLRCRPDRIVSSPLIRAVETAEIVAEALPASHDVEKTAMLEPEVGPDKLIRWLQKQPRQDMLLVGHLPSLEYLVGALLGGDTPVRMVLKKAGACCVSFEKRIAAGEGTLEWLLQPKQLRLLGRTA